MKNPTNTWRLNNMLLYNQWINDQIKTEIRQYMETNDNKNSTLQKSLGRREGHAKRKVYCEGPQCCIGSLGDRVTKAPKSSQTAGLSVPRWFCLPVLSPEQEVLCNPCPFSTPYTVKSFKVPAFFCPRAAGCRYLFPTSGWNLSLSEYPSCLSYLPTLFLFLPSVSWGGGRHWVQLGHSFATLPFFSFPQM